MTLTRCFECKQVREHQARGLCGECYERLRNRARFHNEPIPYPTYFMRAKGIRCKIEGCRSKVRCKRLCTKHYFRMRTHGSPYLYKTTSGRLVAEKSRKKIVRYA